MSNSTFQKFWEELTNKERLEFSESMDNHSDEEYSRFKCDFKKGLCYLCQCKLSEKTSAPCLHHLLIPKFKVKELEKVLHNNTFYQVQSYLRWAANQERLFGNISNLKEEISKNKIVEITILYADFEWSFSISAEDLVGHQSSKNAKFPHYHFQMKEGGLMKIKYNKFHIPLTESDLFNIQGERDGIMKWYDGGAGIQEALEMQEQGHLGPALSVTEDESLASLHTSHMLMDVSGKGISGDDIADILEEQKRTKETFDKIAKRKLKDISIVSVHSAADSVPEIEKRNNPRKKRD